MASAMGVAGTRPPEGARTKRRRSRAVTRRPGCREGRGACRSHPRAGPPGLGGSPGVVPSRQGPQGGGGRGDGCQRRRHRAAAGGGGHLRAPAPRGEDRQGAGRGSAAGAQGRQPCGEAGLEPRLGWARPQAEPASLDPVAAVWLQGRQEEQPPVCGGGRGQGWDTRKRRALRGGPARRPAALGAWQAASQGGTSGGNASRVRRVQARHSVGRDCPSAHWPRALEGASGHRRHPRA